MSKVVIDGADALATWEMKHLIHVVDTMHHDIRIFRYMYGYNIRISMIENINNKNKKKNKTKLIRTVT